MNATLDRPRIVIPKTVADTRSKLEKEARRCLGYSGPSLSNDIIAIDDAHVLQVMQELEIHPIREDIVKAHMKKMEEEANAEALQKIAPEIARIQDRAKFATRLGLIFFSLALACIGTYAFTEMRSLLIVFVAFTCFGIYYRVKQSSILIDQPKPDRFWWTQTALTNYNKEVPEPIQKLAMSLKRRLPVGEFFIHELGTDPIVEFFIFKKSYYIDEYDEPKLDAKRM